MLWDANQWKKWFYIHQSFEMELAGTILEYATTQPLCKEENTYFFVQIPGIKAKYKIEGRVYQVEAGFIAKEFLTIAPIVEGIELTAICDVKNGKDAVAPLAKEHKISQTFGVYDELLKSEIDTVYVALPNNLHFHYTKEALKAGKNVIVEKPFTSNYEEALILANLAKEKQLFLFEAITTLHLENFKRMKETLTKLGDIKIVQCNYSQYSKRYDTFKEGTVLPAFSPAYSGGALMDLNIYNIHYVVGLFGEPKAVAYYPNIEKGIDTSGILILDYGTFKCTCVGAKDCKAPIANYIQGEKGCIYQDSSANVCLEFEVQMNDGESKKVKENRYENRMVEEFIAFEAMIQNNEKERCYQLLEHSLIVAKVQTMARKKAGIVFEADIVKER